MEVQKKIQKVAQQHKCNPKNNSLLTSIVRDTTYNKSIRLNSEYLNSFIYNDHITNDKLSIQLGNPLDQQLKAKLRYSHKDQSSDISTVANINQCFHLMKKTRKFHLNSIQAFNYHKYNRANLDQSYKDESQFFRNSSEVKLESYRKKKLDEAKNFANEKSILALILQNHSEKRQKMAINSNKSSADTMVQSLYPANKKFKQPINKKAKSQKSRLCQIDNYRFRYSVKKDQNDLQNEIIKQTTSDIKRMVRKNGEYLITPKTNKRVNLLKKKKIKRQNQEKQQVQTSKIGQFNKSQSSDKSSILKTMECPLSGPNNQKSLITSNKYFQRDELDNYEFKMQDQDMIIKKMKFIFPEAPVYITDDKMKEAEANIISSIEAGNYFRVQIQLSVNPALIHTKQAQNSNNLLHICIMNNKEQIFQMILRKCKDLGVDLLAQENKYGRTPYELGKILEFFKKKQLINLLASTQKDRRFGVYNLLFNKLLDSKK